MNPRISVQIFVPSRAKGFPAGRSANAFSQAARMESGIGGEDGASRLAA